MSDLIRREDVLTVLCFCEETKMMLCKDLRKILEKIDAIPSAEPERQKGKWIKVGHWGRSYKCNQCGNFLDFDGVNAGRGDANFCPNCGTDMRGKNEKA